MSIRARRVNSINYEKSESFNLSHDNYLMFMLLAESNFHYRLSLDGGGIGEVPVSVLKKIIKNKNLSKEVKDNLKVDIKWAKDNDEEYIQYYCF